MFSCDGTTGANSIIIAAAEQAYQDGMDIINLCASCSMRLSRDVTQSSRCKDQKTVW